MGDPADLEQLARQLEHASDYRVLRRVPDVSRYATEVPAATVHRGLIVDAETTGLDPARDKIIELAVLPFDFSSQGGLYAVHEGYAGFEDPDEALPELVTRLTGITDDDVRGQGLEDETVAGLAEEAALVVAAIPVEIVADETDVLLAAVESNMQSQSSAIAAPF